MAGRLACILGSLLALGSLLPTGCGAGEAPPPRPADLRQQLHEQVRGWVLRGELARSDGYTYTVDAGQLMAYAALVGDGPMYAALRDWALARVVRDRPDDPYTRGFVAWRWKAGEDLDASGTTEAIRLAEGLWRGAEAFQQPADREKALVILRGYARHAGTDQGVWFIRNYFNFRTRGFATNSFLVDYDPDLVAEAALAAGDADLRDAAERSYALVKQAVAPSGLIYDLVQPEVLTLTPHLRQPAFSPNDVIQLSNSSTVAERVAAGAPGVGRTVLRFAMDRRRSLKPYYLGRTGEPLPAAGKVFPGVETYATLLRLAIRLDDAKAAGAFREPFLRHAAAYARQPQEPRAYTAGEVLLALAMLERENSAHDHRQP